MKQLHHSLPRCVCSYSSICALNSFFLTPSGLLVTVYTPRQYVVLHYKFCKLLNKRNVYFMSFGTQNSCKDFSSIVVTKFYPANVTKIIRGYINVHYHSIWTLTLQVPFYPPSLQQSTNTVPTTCLI
jgi:hypothetical protein